MPLAPARPSAARRPRRWALLVTGALTAAALLDSPSLGAVAAADVAPDPLPATVSADALPTVQINGVVWSQVTVGNTVYATGEFTSARPAGSPAGTDETPRGNLLAYDITTGVLVPGFNHALNAQGLAITASPDGRRVFVGGDFTAVDGQPRYRVAAFDTATGTLVSGFAPVVGARVAALTASSTALYLGGNFASVAGLSRGRLAAVSATDGTPLAWAPTANDRVTAMVLTPDQSKVVVGGGFTTLSGTAAYGMGAVGVATGQVLPWSATATVRNAGASAAITSLRTDGRQVYGTGYVFTGGGGVLEGTFAADPADGRVTWVEDCHGDTYDSVVLGSVLYAVSHEHDCSTVGAFPETSPRTWHRATAFTTTATGTLGHNAVGGYADWYGTPAPTQLDWYPALDAGTYTGQSQAAWSATGNSTYIALGGEFPKVNNVGQQGLVRFAVRSAAPNKMAPRSSATTTPHVTSPQPGTLRVAFASTFDYDDEELTYKVVRDGRTASPVYTKVLRSRFWTLQPLGFVDAGLEPGSTHTYRLSVTDPSGNVTSGGTVSATVSGTPESAYAADVRADGAVESWRLGEPSGSTSYSSTGYSDLTRQAGIVPGAGGAIGGDPDTAMTLSGDATGSSATWAPGPAPSTFSLEAWVRTTSTAGGKIIGFGNATTALSGSYDRQLYMDNSGHLLLGVYAGSAKVVTSPATYNDGTWHHVVGAQSSAGMVLYVDGLRVGRDTATTTNLPTTGYWRVGGDNLNGWPSKPTSNFLAGSLDEVAVYPTALDQSVVRRHYTDSGRTVAAAPAPTDAYGRAVYGDSPELYWRADDAAGPTAADTVGVTPGTYSGGVSYRAPSRVTPSGTGVTLDGASGLIVSSRPVTNPTVYSEELWFRTTSRSGGKLIGFGNAATGASSSYDRHVWMLNGGQLVFGAYTGVTNTAQTPASYNDGAWHQVVATQGPDGMRLYVDGAQVASNPTTGSQSYTGYWRVGGDTTWGGNTSSYLAASVDEIAVYASQLSADAVRLHYRASSAAANTAPVAAATASCSGLDCTLSGTGSSDVDGTVASYAWSFGDGTTGTGATVRHTYAAGSYTARLTVTDDQGATGTTTRDVVVSALPADAYGRAVRTDDPSLYWRLEESAGPVAADASPYGSAGAYSGGVGYRTPSPVATAGGTGVTLDGATGAVISQRAVTSPSASSEEAWFRTQSTSGGKIIGFGNAASGTSTSFDRHVWLLDTGELSFGTYDGQQNTVRSPGRYNDGVWHQVVATQGADGMHLYVDGAEVASGPVTTALSYTGYWRVGGDATWGGTTSRYVAASVDEVAVYDRQLSAARVAAHYAASPARANAAPVARTTQSCTLLACSFDASGSTDADGTIASYAWDFGDGSTGAGATPSHTYAAAGSYAVVLTVTDDRGGQGTVSAPVTVAAAPPNQAPTARATTSCAALVCTFDASTSADPDGTVASYAWAFGDGSTGTGPRVTHAYPAAGDYPARLTVTDDRGATGSTAAAVAPRPAPRATAPFAADAFGRTVSGGLGTADTGGAWTVTGTAANLSVAGGTASLLMPTATTQIGGSLNTAKVTDSDTTVTITSDKPGTGSGIFAYVVGRRVGVNNEYRTRVRLAGKAVSIGLTRLAGSASETVVQPDVAVPSIAYAAGTLLRVRTQVTGTAPTVLRAKVWVAGTAEPADWTVQATDTTAGLQAAGGVGVTAYLLGSSTNAPVVLKVSDFAAAPSPAASPAAAFTTSCTGLACSADGSTSTDPSGTAPSLTWSWGDGVVTTGPTSSHAYAAPGSYRVTLTATNAAGATDVTTRTVDVTA